MKVFVLGLILLLAVPCFAADGDITQAEVRPDVVRWELDTVRFLVITQTCEVDYRKVDADGNAIGGVVRILFTNEEDDPETEADETKTEFTQLVNLINNGDNIKASITTAVKIKLGL